MSLGGKSQTPLSTIVVAVAKNPEWHVLLEIDNFFFDNMFPLRDMMITLMISMSSSHILMRMCWLNRKKEATYQSL